MAISGVLGNVIGRFEAEIESSKENNEKKSLLIKQIIELQEVIDKAERVKGIYSTLLNQLTVAATNYRNTRKRELEEETKKVLQLLFPDEGFEIAIEWNSIADTPTARILSGIKDIHGNIEWSLPKNVHGEFVKQLIAFIIICNMAILLGAESFYCDEPLNSGDNVSLKRTKDIMERLQQALHITTIEHKAKFFSGLDRHEILLYKVGTTTSGYVSILGSKDLDGGQINKAAEYLDYDEDELPSNKLHLEATVNS